MIVFEKTKIGYDVFYSVDSDSQFLGTIEIHELDKHVDYYKSFGNEIEIR